ncbi:MAG: TetR family transcriptional regulator [Ancalomicrobiaceae bacterium]|nr:TetR family transcriptional regulator [Ancalomicrobiaceae bacterium]
MTTDELRPTIIDAALALAAERSYLSVGLADIAKKADVPLEALRARYDGRIAILDDFARSIDERMLAGHDAASASESPRDRLFEVMMRRFDALAAYRPGLRGLRRVALRNPMFAALMNRIAVGSGRWVLASAGIEPSGTFAPVRSLARAQVLALITASVIPTFLDDDENGLPKTMAALDKALARLDRFAKSVSRFEDACDQLVSCRPKKRRTPEPDSPPPAAPEPTADMATAV